MILEMAVAPIELSIDLFNGVVICRLCDRKACFINTIIDSIVVLLIPLVNRFFQRIWVVVMVISGERVELAIKNSNDL